MRKRRVAFVVFHSTSVVLAGLAALTLPPRLAAQLTTTRGLFVSATRDTATPNKLLPRAELFAAVDMDRQRDATFQSTDYRLGVLVDVARFGSRTSLSLMLGTELEVAPDNSIGFDPRGVIWEEQVAFSSRRAGATWKLAAFMRCRHDVDNGTPVEPPDEPILIQARGRTITLPGAQLGASSPEWKLSRRIGLRVEGYVEGYVHPGDRRTPKSLISPDWGDARGAASVTARVTVAMSERVAVYARDWQSHVLFDGAVDRAHVETNVRGELGLHLRGPATDVDLFMARERTFDDAMTVQPRRVSSFAMGARIGGPNFF